MESGRRAANNPDLGEAVEEIEAEYKGKPLSIGFNARYFMDVLAVLSGEGDVDVESPDRPAASRSGTASLLRYGASAR